MTLTILFLKLCIIDILALALIATAANIVDRVLNKKNSISQVLDIIGGILIISFLVLVIVTIIICLVTIIIYICQH